MDEIHTHLLHPAPYNPTTKSLDFDLAATYCGDPNEPPTTTDKCAECHSLYTEAKAVARAQMIVRLGFNPFVPLSTHVPNLVFRTGQTESNDGRNGHGHGRRSARRQ